MTDAELRAILDYDQATGIFRWRMRSEWPSNVASKMTGKVAGTLNRHGYIMISIDGKKHPAHRLAWLYHYGEWPPGSLDHVDLDRKANNIANLRLATKSQNAANTHINSKNTSGIKGVAWHAGSGKWRARITFNQKEIYLGVYDEIEKAAAAYAVAAKRFYGDFARTA